MAEQNLYDAFAAVLSYPDEEYLDRADDLVLATPDEIEPEVEEFAQALEGKSLLELQELFTVTFDLNPVCSLELGWHLFGENYDRGLLLVKMRALLREHWIAESGELPDHLSYALRLIARMEPQERHDFAVAIVLPALGKMLDAFRGKQNPYEKVLTAIKSELRSLCPGEAIFIPQQEPVLRVLD